MRCWPVCARGSVCRTVSFGAIIPSAFLTPAGGGTIDRFRSSRPRARFACPKGAWSAYPVMTRTRRRMGRSRSWFGIWQRVRRGWSVRHSRWTWGGEYVWPRNQKPLAKFQQGFRQAQCFLQGSYFQGLPSEVEQVFQEGQSTVLRKPKGSSLS